MLSLSPAHHGQEFEGGEEASLASFCRSFFRELTVGGVARPVDTLLMAGLILYGAAPFEKAVKSQTRQLAFVFQVWYLCPSGCHVMKQVAHCCSCMCLHAGPTTSSSL